MRWLLFLLLIGCALYTDSRQAELYKKADEKYQQGLRLRNEILQSGELVSERLAKEVLPLWEEGVQLYSNHRGLQKELGKLYLFLGEEESQRGETILESLEKRKKEGSLDPAKRSALEKKAKVALERARIYLTRAISHLKAVLKLGENPSEIEILLGRACLFLNHYDKALFYFRSALERGDLPPERQVQIQEALELLYRLMRKE